MLKLPMSQNSSISTVMPGSWSCSSPTSSAPLAVALTWLPALSIRDAIVPPVLTRTTLVMPCSLPGAGGRQHRCGEWLLARPGAGLRRVAQRDADAVGSARDVQPHLPFRAIRIAPGHRLDDLLVLANRLPHALVATHRDALALEEDRPVVLVQVGEDARQQHDPMVQLEIRPRRGDQIELPRRLLVFANDRLESPICSSVTANPAARQTTLPYPNA